MKKIALSLIAVAILLTGCGNTARGMTVVGVEVVLDRSVTSGSTAYLTVRKGEDTLRLRCNSQQECASVQRGTVVDIDFNYGVVTDIRFPNLEGK